MSVDAGLKQLKVISRGEAVAGSEFQSLEVIGIKELAKALVRSTLGTRIQSTLIQLNSIEEPKHCKIPNSTLALEDVLFSTYCL